MDPISPLRRAPVQARAKERIERVLDAAEAVFVEGGYDAATTNQIAARAGTSIGSIYEFFGNKQAVANALSDRYLAELRVLHEQLVVDDQQGGEVVVATVVDALDEFARRHPGLGPLLRGGRGSADLAAIGDALQASLVDHVERVIAVQGIAVQGIAVQGIAVQGIAVRREAVDPQRRGVVARICADVLRCVLDDIALRPESERAPMVAELKVMLTAYLAAALPRG